MEQDLQSLAYKHYNQIDMVIKKDVLKAIKWAQEKIDSIEGPLKGKEYILNIITGFDDMQVCLIYTEDNTFTHYGQRSDDGAQAIVLAICEYMLGFNNPKMSY